MSQHAPIIYNIRLTMRTKPQCGRPTAVAVVTWSPVTDDATLAATTAWHRRRVVSVCIHVCACSDWGAFGGCGSWQQED